MSYLDCYMDGDLDGFPSMTYVIDANEKTVSQALQMLQRQYDRVERVKETQGQSPVLLSAFLIAACHVDGKPPTIQNVVEDIASESSDIVFMA